jgi:hypothetical protein
MGEDLAAYFAGRIRAEHALSSPPTEEEILAVCAQRGVHVRVRPGLRGQAYYLDWPHPLIVHRPDAAAAVPHELFHHLIADNTGWGIHYHAPHWREEDPEILATRFQALLSEQEEARSKQNQC